MLSVGRGRRVMYANLSFTTKQKYNDTAGYVAKTIYIAFDIGA